MELHALAEEAANETFDRDDPLFFEDVVKCIERALAKLQREHEADIVCVPRKLTYEMARAMELADMPLPPARLEEQWQPTWDAALAAAEGKDKP